MLCTREHVVNNGQNVCTQHTPPIECYLRYRFRIRTLNPNFNRNLKSNNDLCTAKQHQIKIKDSVINRSYFIRQGVGR